jgi:hypothetical protein
MINKLFGKTCVGNDKFNHEKIRYYSDLCPVCKRIELVELYRGKADRLNRRKQGRNEKYIPDSYNTVWARHG